MPKGECPHIKECKQFISKKDFDIACLGKIAFNQENCFKTNKMGKTKQPKLPLEWSNSEFLNRLRCLTEDELKLLDDIIKKHEVTGKS
jgi:hypothetical protein